MISDFARGAGYLLQGFRLLNRSGVRRFVLVPMLINIILFSLLIYFGMGYFESLVESLLPQGDAWWVGIARVLLWMVFALVVLLALFFAFTLVANLVASPFNGLLAEAVERVLTGGEMPAAGLMQAVRDFVPAMLIELRKYGYFGVIAIVLLVLTIVPVVNFVAPFLWVLFSAWMLVLEYVAYPMENHGQRFPAARAAARRHRAMGLGFGLAVSAIMLVPLLNFVVMPAAVAGATAMWVEVWRGSSA